MSAVTESKSKAKAQVPFAQKAAALKKAAAAKRQQKIWLQRENLHAPAPEIAPPLPPERERAVGRAQGPPRLLSKAEVIRIVGFSFPSIWTWMRKGAFPRSRIVGGKSMWRSDEVEAWLAALPIRRLKGDDAEVVA